MRPDDFKRIGGGIGWGVVIVIKEILLTIFYYFLKIHPRV